MTVHFIGAGPGAVDLITVRGRDLLSRCPVCLYAGSIVPTELLAYCPAQARIVDTAPMTLDAIEQEFLAADARGLDVARLHSGDLSVYSALAEQIRRLDRLGRKLGSDVAKRSAYDALIGPARPHHNRYRAFGAIGRRQLFHDRSDRVDCKVNDQGRFGRCERDKSLALGHTRSSAGHAGEHDALRDLRDRQLAADCSGGRREGRHARRERIGDSVPIEPADLLGERAVDRKIARV